ELAGILAGRSRSPAPPRRAEEPGSAARRRSAAVRKRLSGARIGIIGRHPGYQEARVERTFGATTGDERIELVLASGLAISGFVRDHLGKPLPGAGVTAFLERVEKDARMEERIQVLIQLPEMQSEEGVSAVTDSEGYYQLTGLEASKYRLRVSSHGHTPEERRQVPAGSKDVNFTLGLGGILSGRVQDAGGAPITEAQVDVYQQTDTSDIIEVIVERALPPAASAETDAGGLFSFDELGGSVQYRMMVQARGYQIHQLEKISVGVGQDVDLDITLDRGKVIRGIVYDPYGAELEGARAKAIFQGGRPSKAPIDLQDDGVFTGEDGVFVFDTLEDGYYRVVVSHPDFATFHENRVKADNTELTVRLTQGGAVAGHIFDSQGGGAIAGATIAVRDVGGVEKKGISDAKGYYLVRGITVNPKGTANIDVAADGYKRETNNQVPVEEEVVTEGQDFLLDRNGSVSGKVVDSAGNALAGCRVSVRRAHSPSTSVIVNVASPVASRSDGTFEVPDVAPGGETFLEGSHSEYLTSQSESFEIEPGASVTGLELVMKLGGSISGMVVDEAGVAIESVVVGVRDDWFGEVNPEVLPHNDRSGPAGDYRIGSLAEGTHTLLASAPGYLDLEVSGIKVVEGHDTGGIEVRMVRGATIAGTVRDVAGDPIGGARVTVIDTAGGLRKMNTMTGPDGIYHFDELGRYPVDVEASASGFSRVRLYEQQVNRNDVDFVLDRLGSIRGFVYDVKGDPVRAFSVAPRRHESGREIKVASKTFQKGTGEYEYVDLEPGDYTIVFGAPGYTTYSMENVRIRQGGETELPNVTLEEGGRLSGRVIDALNGEPVLGATVTVLGGTRNFIPGDILRGGGRRSGRRDQRRTDRDGYFEFIGLAAERVNVKVEHRDFLTLNLHDEPVGGGDLEIALDAGGIIEGMLFGADGTPRPGVQILITGGPKRHSDKAVTDRKGFYSFTGLGSGTYTLRVTEFGRAGVKRANIANAPTYEVGVATGTVLTFDITLEE
ncbi:MAG: carboxypeptidase regulatory-like domain-containing protein, partial [Planctomycetota bacterium]